MLIRVRYNGFFTYEEMFDPLQYQTGDSYDDCLFLDLEKEDKEWKTLYNSTIKMAGSRPRLTVDGDYLYCLTWDMIFYTDPKGNKRVKQEWNHVFRYDIAKGGLTSGGWEEVHFNIEFAATEK